MYSSVSQINNIADVEKFVEYLYNTRHIAFHPDDNFLDYVFLDGQNKGRLCFAQEESSLFNLIVNKSFAICQKENIDFYSLVLNQQIP